MKRILIVLAVLCWSSAAFGWSFNDYTDEDKAKVDVITVTGGNAGDVLTLQSDGSWIPAAPTGGGMTYPSAGIAMSTGSAWTTPWDYDFGDLINVPAYLLAESDPTVDTSAEIQAIIGAGVYEPADANILKSGEQNAGTDITADLEEETHASEHATAGGDAISPTDIGAAAASHAHTGADLSGIDISDDTNLAGTANEIVLTGDTLSIHADIARDSELHADESDASTTVKGVVELAIGSEVTAGTSEILAVTPNALAGSGYAIRYPSIVLFRSDQAVTVGDGTTGIPIALTGYNIIDIVATVDDKGITGTTDIQVRRRRAGTDVDALSTKVTIGDEFFAQDETVDTSNDDLAVGDILYVDVDAVHSGTPPNGLSVAIVIQLVP